MSNPIQNNTNYATALNQANRYRADNTLHLYKFSEGELRLKTGLAKTMAWILHAIGVTDQKQLYFKMAPQLLEGVHEGLRQMQPTPLASHITSLTKIATR